jgi:glycine cleavage system H protein
MRAGLLSFKLCERGLDCERCPLDAALSGSAPRPAGGSAAPGEAPAGRAHLRFPTDRRYGASHAWALALTPGRVRIGLDMFAGRLLGRPTGIVLPPVGARLQRGRPACWIEVDDDLIPIRAPVSGAVTARNTALQERPALLAEAPYDGGWLLEVRVEPGAPGADELHPADRARRATAKHLRRVQADVRRATTRDPRVGATMRDGGRPVGDLRALLGPRRWRRAVAAILN